MSTQPTGTVTLLFTDIEGSTQLLAQLGAARYAETLAQHRQLVRAAIVAHDGHEVGTEGDSFFVAFGRADDAVAAAADAQRALATAQWPDDKPVRVRMGIHTGEPLAGEGNYVGIDVHRAARIMAAGHGGQVLVSATTRALLSPHVVAELRDLGAHHLKDLPEPVSLYQLAIDGQVAFPPLRSLHRTNLPTPAWPLVGRSAELQQIRTLVASGVRLVTLTGPGGSGKTRLAIQAAGMLSDSFPDGVYFAPLAALRDASAVVPALAEAIGLQPDDDVASWLGSRRALVVLDNLEQLADVSRVVASLLVGSTVILATSRSPLHLSVEHELAVLPLADEAAVELFVARAGAAGRRVEPDSVVRAICRRLDNLPLALELAAARSKLLSPVALLERLDATLPMLSGGARDLPERQRTLRATIEWSHELLDDGTRSTFRRLSVFRGSFTLDAAEAVTGCDLDAIATLVDQSLLAPQADGRLLMLETIREFARERLEEAGEMQPFALRHARYFLARLEWNERLQHTARATEALDWVRDEEENLATMFDRLSDFAPLEAARAGWLMSPFYTRLGASTEGAARLRSLLDLEALGEAERARLLTRLAGLDIRLGNLTTARGAAEQAAVLSEGVGDRDVFVDALSWLASLASAGGDASEAIALGTRALAEAETLDPATRLHALMDLGSLLGDAGRTGEARETLGRAAAEARSMGHVTAETYTMYNLGALELAERRFEEARAAMQRALEVNRQVGDSWIAASARFGLGLSCIGLGRRADARRALLERLDLVLAAREPAVADAAITMSALALTAEPEDAERAARLTGAASAACVPRGDDPERLLALVRADFERPLVDALGGDVWVAAEADGRSMTLEEGVPLARSMATGRTDRPGRPI